MHSSWIRVSAWLSIAGASWDCIRELTPVASAVAAVNSAIWIRDGSAEASRSGVGRPVNRADRTPVVANSPSAWHTPDNSCTVSSVATRQRDCSAASRNVRRSSVGSRPAIFQNVEAAAST